MQQPPGFPPPPAQGPYSPQPWPDSSTAPGPYQGQPGRPGSVTAAAVLLIILAIPPILFAILAFVGAGVFHTENGKLSGTEFAGLGDAVARIIVVFGIVALAYGVAKLIAGIRTLAGRNGWRVTGIVLSAIGAAFWVLALIGSINGNNNNSSFDTNSGPNAGGIALSIAFLVMNVLAIVLLARSGEYFAARSFSTGSPQQWQQPQVQQQSQWPQPQQWPPPGQGGGPGQGYSQ